ncbi:MAG: hypothetical protein KDC87_05615, partial [Planctomycetes bacterium]|nr:hypothetical protein [Planctomycetota bacterium]
PTRVEVLEQNQARQVLLYRCRIGRTGLLFELILTCYRGQAHFQADVALFFSDPTSAAMQVAVQEVAIESSGLVLALRNARAFGVTQQITPAGSRTTLLRDAVLGDGQGIRRSGVLRPPLGGKGPALAARTHDAAALVPVLAATSWRGTGAYGPFGYVPVPPPWLEGSAGRQALALRHRQFVAWSARPGDPFVRCDHMLAKDPSQTGDQGDFGILRLEPVVSTGLPSFLLEVEPSVLQEACRPVHFFEADGTPVRTQKHPDWVVWDGRAHWNKEASPDRLGKPHPQPKFHANGWFGKDRQHWSSNYLCGYYLLTGAAWARREIDNEVQLFLGMQTVRPGLGTTGRGAPRAAGRMLLLGCWLYQCTGDQALLDRMRQRMLVSHLPGWFGRELPEGKVRPLNVHPPDNRVLNGATKFWSPWMEAIAAVGYFALYRTTGDETAKHMADVISATVLQHGWLIDRTGAHVGYAIRWNEDASPITEQQMHAREPTVCHWASGGIGLWALGGVSVALHFAKLRQDTASVAKAERILQMLRAGRMRRTADGWWDPLAAWDAVRDADEEKAK